MFMFAKVYRTVTSYFRRHGRGLVSKTGDFGKEKVGGGYDRGKTHTEGNPIATALLVFVREVQRRYLCE